MNKKLEKLKKPYKHLLLDINDDDIIDIWERFDKDYEKKY